MSAPRKLVGRTGRITWADRGTVIDGIVGDGVLEPMYVLSRCPYQSVGYYCETHTLPLANVGNLVMHLEEPTEHHIAVFCPAHRVYEAPDDAQMLAFAAIDAAAPPAPKDEP